MAVKLNWTAPDNASKVTIYRALSKIQHNALPAPLTELDGTVTSYSDATAIRNTVYHYVVAVEAADGTVRMSQSQSHGYYPDTGHGPSKLIRGDYNEGYFGSISAAEFFSAISLGAAMKLVSSQVDSYFSWSNTAPVWDKFALDGKILLIPRTSIALVQPRHVYYSGFMYGTDDNGKYPTNSILPSYGAANQKRLVERDGYRYRVRTIRSSTKETDQIVDVGNPETEDLRMSEYNRTKGRMFRDQYSYQSSRPRYGNTAAVLTTTASSTGTQTCSSSATSGVVARGMVTAPDAATSQGVTTLLPWCPVLELEL